MTDQLIMPVQRAVYCILCAKPTGERVEPHTPPTYVYCTDCRDLPQPWQTPRDSHGNRFIEVSGERVNTEEQARDRGATPLVGNAADHRHRILDDPPDYDEDNVEEPDERATCGHCGGMSFLVVHEAIGHVYHRTRTSDNDYDDNSLWIEDGDYDSVESGDIVRVECRECDRTCPELLDNVQWA